MRLLSLWEGEVMKVGTKEEPRGTFLVVQQIRIHQPTQGTLVRSLVREDSTRHGATNSDSHNYRARMPQLLKPARLEPVPYKRCHRNEKPVPRNQRVARAKQQRGPSASKKKKNASGFLKAYLLTVICIKQFCKRGSCFLFSNRFVRMS